MKQPSSMTRKVIVVIALIPLLTLVAEFLELFSFQTIKEPATNNCTIACESKPFNNYATQFDEAKAIGYQLPPNRARATGTNYGKSAMIWAGTIKTALQHVDQIRKHLLEPNDMDIYVLIDRSSGLLSRSGEKDPRDPEEVFNRAWGNRLRGLWFIEEDDGFRVTIPLNFAQNELRMTALERLIEKHNTTARNNTGNLEQSVFWRGGSYLYPYSSRWNWWAVDQYARLQRLTQLAKPFILSRGYERVLRFRADVEFTEDTLFTHFELPPNRMYIVPHTKGTVTEVWLAQPKLSLHFSEKFMEDYLRLIPNVLKHWQRLNIDEMLYWTLAPEATLMQMILRYNVDAQELCHSFKAVQSTMEEYNGTISAYSFSKQEECEKFTPDLEVSNDYLTYVNGEYLEIQDPNTNRE